MELIELTRVCTKCGKRKPFKEFHKKKDDRFGVFCKCKICIKIYNKIYYKDNSEKAKVYSKTYYKNNREKEKLYRKAYYKINSNKFKKLGKFYYKANAEKKKAYQKAYYNSNLEKAKLSRRVYYKNNSEKLKAYRKDYYKANPEKLKDRNKQNQNKQELKPNFKLNKAMRTGILQSLKNGNGKNGKSWLNLVPYTLDDLIKRLKKTLPNGYKWDDYANGKTDLSIDHIIPISAHNFKSYKDTDFQRCWALKNLRLLPLKENMSKGAKLDKPFQPSLLL